MERSGSRLHWSRLAVVVLVALVATVAGCSSDATGPQGGDDCDPETDDELCARIGADCGEVTKTDNCGDERTVECGECVGDESCGAVEDHLCGCPCEVDGACTGAGEVHPDEVCSVCDAEESGFVAADDGTECDDGDECTVEGGNCRDGACVAEPNCEGTDTECGCTDCVDCTDQDEWVDVGDPWECCDAGEACWCQEQVLREYGCEGTDCEYEETDERVVATDCEYCGVAGCSDGQCACPDECCGDEDCDSNQQCCDGDCISSIEVCDAGGCTTDVDCGQYAQCCDGQCLSNTTVCPSQCTTDGDCGPDGQCCDGECIPSTQTCGGTSCFDDSDCDFDEYCCGGYCIPNDQYCY